MNPQQGEQQGSEPPLQIPPVRQGYGRRPAHRSPPPPVRKRAAAYMAPARAAPRVRQDSLTTLPPPAAAAPAPAKDAWVRYVHVSGDAYWHNAATGESRWRSEQRFGKYWSMVWRDDRILALDSDGALYLVGATPERFDLLDGLQVADEETWGHLAVSGEDIFVRELEAISAWRWPTESASLPAPSQ